MRRPKFSTKQIFAITSAVAALMGLAVRLKLVGWTWWIFAAFSVYALAVCFVFLPALIRSLLKLRRDIVSLKKKRAAMEEEANSRRLIKK